MVNMEFRAHKDSLDQMAVGKWSRILEDLGVPADVLRKNKHQPCPRCGGHDRFRFTDKSERGDGFCRGCGHLDGFAIAGAYGVKFMDVIAHLEDLFGVRRPKANQTQSVTPQKPYFERIWEESVPLSEGDPAVKYLRSRGLHLKTLPLSLRFHARLEHTATDTDQADVEEGKAAVKTVHPALIGLIRDETGKPVGVQRIYVNTEGGKANVDGQKKGLGKVNAGGAVRLRSHAGHLGIAEGIETAEACFEIFGIPTWAAVTAGNLEKLEVPKGVKHITIFGDLDVSFTGQKSVAILAHRYYDKIKVDVQFPSDKPYAPFQNVDFLDILGQTKAQQLQ